MDGSRCPACGRALAKREDSVDEQVREQVKQLRHELRAARHEISKLHRQLNVFGRNVAKELSMVRRTALDAAATVVERATRGSGKIPVASSTTANRAPHRTHTTTQDPSPHPKSSRSNFCSSAWWRCLSALTPPAVLVPPPVVLSAPDAINPPTVTTPPAPHRAEHTPPYPPPYPPYPPLPAPPPMPHHYPPIGRIESCYTHKNGTPRQPALSPSALSRLRIEWGSNPHHTLEGIHLFSHIWYRNRFGEWPHFSHMSHPVFAISRNLIAKKKKKNKKIQHPFFPYVATPFLPYVRDLFFLANPFFPYVG